MTQLATERRLIDLAATSDAALRQVLHGLPGVDQVGTEARTAGLATRSIKRDAKLRALDMALAQRRPDGVIHHSDSNNVSTSFSTARPVTAVVGLPEGLVPRSVPDGLTHIPIDLICCPSLDPSAGRGHRTARFHLAAACDPRRA